MAVLPFPFVVNEKPASPVAGNHKSPFGSTYAQNAQRFVDLGFSSLPIVKGEKRPAISGWQQRCKRPPAPAEIVVESRIPGAGIGLAMGTPVGEDIVFAFDIDCEGEDLDRLASSLPYSPMEKRGAKGLTRFYRGVPSLATKQYRRADGSVLADVLARGRQSVVPPSLHPSGISYTWTAGPVAASKLPLFTLDDWSRVEDTLGALGWPGATSTADAPGEAVPEASRAAGNGSDVSIRRALNDRALSTAGGDRDDPNIWRKTNDTALQKLDRWVPDLGLPKLKRHSSGRWEAVPTWRESGSGRPTMQRNPNLSFHHLGIKDLGTDIGYTPLDVVGAVMSWDFDHCFSWLRAKIGLGNEGDALLHGASSADATSTIEDETGTVRDAATGEPVGATNDNCPASADLFPDALTRVPGLLGDVIEWIVASARNPDRIMALGGALTVLGTLAGRRDAGPTKAGTSLYVLMLATSGAGKQHGLNQVHRLMAAAGAKEHVGPGEFGSVQALNNHLKRAPLSVCAQDEFGGFLKRINDKRAGSHEKAISKVLRSVWGINFGITQTTDFAGTRGETIHAPCLSIYGVSTPGEFYKSLDGSDVENGTLNRFLLLSASATVEDIEPELDDASVPPELEWQLNDLFWARGREPPPPATPPDDEERGRRPPIRNLGEDPVTPQFVYWHDDEAKAVFDAMGEDVKRLRIEEPALAPFLARTVEIALRLATIRAVGRTIDGRIIDDPTIDADDIAWGRDVAMWSANKMAVEVGDFVSDNPTGEIWGKVKNKLRKAGGSGNRRDVARAFTMSARTMDEVVSGMEGAGLIRVENRRPAGGGKAAVWLHLLDGT